MIEEQNKIVQWQNHHKFNNNKNNNNKLPKKDLSAFSCQK